MPKKQILNIIFNTAVAGGLSTFIMSAEPVNAQFSQEGAQTEDIQNPKNTRNNPTDWYETYAPENSYDETLCEGSANILVLELNTDSHSRLVGHIARLSSEDMSRRLGASTRPNILLEQGSLKEDSQENLQRFNAYDVINFSTGQPPDMLSGLLWGSIAPFSKYETDKMNNPIIVQGIGNYGRNQGDYNKEGFDLDTPDDVQFYPYSIQVGEVSVDSQGKFEVDPHSAKAAPTVVAVNLSDTNKFKYKDPNSLTQQEKKLYKIDEEGFYTAVDGTSFSTPNISGALGSAKELYPNLSNDELLTVLASSAELPEEIMKQASYSSHTFPYQETAWGYGVFNPRLFAKNLVTMNDLVNEYGSTSTETTQINEFEQEKITKNGEIYTAHTFNVEENLVAGKIAFSAMMPIRVYPPDHFIVISPDGEEKFIPSSISRTSRFATEAFMGTPTKGEWQILFPEESRAIMPNDEGHSMAMQIDTETGELYNAAAVLTINGTSLSPEGDNSITRFIGKIHQERGLEQDVQMTNRSKPNQPNFTL